MTSTATPTEQALFDAARAACSSAWELYRAASHRRMVAFDTAHGEAPNSHLWADYEAARVREDQAIAAYKAIEAISNQLTGAA